MFVFDFFKFLFKDENFDRIVVEINCYVQQSIVVKADLLWYEITVDEIRIFFVLNILFGIKQLLEIYVYWLKNLFFGVLEV